MLLRLLARIALTVGAAWLLSELLPGIVDIGGGYRGIAIVGLLLAMLNTLVRGPLDLVTLPLRLLSRLLVSILVNGALLWLATILIAIVPADIATFRIVGGILGWVIAACAFGLASWIVRILTREAR
jgi:uncharacterized membrane protein YvlD (DUF360 family)